MGQQAVHQRDIAAESASLEAEIEGRTLCRAFADTAANLGSREAVRWRAGGAWTGVSWRAYHEAVRFFALGVHALGFPKGGFAVLLTPNRVEHLIASHGVVHAGGTPVGLYDATASEQIAYVARHCQAALCVVEARLLPKLLAAVRRDLASVGRVIVVGSREPPAASEGWVTGWDEVLATGKAAAQDSTARERLATGVQPDDLAAVIYTSGTCGTPKGVMVTHRTALAIMASFQRLAQLSPEDRLVSYLPLAHVSEHMLSLWGHVLYGMTTHLCEERGELLPMLRDVRPTFFFAPPGIWDAFRTAVRPLASDGNTRPHHGMLSRIGLDECRLPITAAAPIAPDLLSFFHGLGLDISEAWGMTECGVGTWNLGQTRGGTVGPTLPGLEGRIDRDGELLVRGGAVMAGYYRDPEQTAEAVDPEGWLHTGDLAEVDEDDCYRILGRKKDLIITPFGKNICPTDLENLLKAHPLIREAAVFGDARPFLTALLVLDEQAAAGWAREHGLESAPPESLAENADLLNEVRQAVGSVNRQLSGPEQIQRFTVLPVEWSVENGELTPTLKIRRSVIGEKFARDIARMYGDGLSS